MKEIGIVKSIKGQTAKVEIQRHAACGTCGACQVSKDKQTMLTKARNEAQAQVGDTVAVEMEFANLLRATSVAYGFPLLAFLIGCGVGFYTAPSFGGDQVLTPFFLGVGLMALSFGGIYFMDRNGVFGKRYEPIVTQILPEEMP